jgi:hypothetical protein
VPFNEPGGLVRLADLDNHLDDAAETLREDRRWRSTSQRVAQREAKATGKGLIAVSPTVLAPTRTPFGGAPAQERCEIRCRGCGAIVAHPLSRCPMCGGDDLRPIRADVATGNGEAVR